MAPATDAVYQYSFREWGMSVRLNIVMDEDLEAVDDALRITLGLP